MNIPSKMPHLSPAAPSPGSARISVVVVVWNAKHYVEECLGSLREHCSDVYSEVIVVDNASSDGTPEMIAELFPEFHLILNSENLGFARANNIGIAQSSGDYICLVNSDVKFIDDCVSPMVRYLADHPEAGMLGPKMLAQDGEVRRSTMRFPTVWNNFCRAIGLDYLFKGSRSFGGLLMSDFDHSTTAEVEVLNGWFLLVRRRAVQRVGLLDPQFFMYGEDVDWCYRFRQAGEKVVFFCRRGRHSLRRSKFFQCPGPILSGTLPRHLAILAKALRQSGPTRFSGGFRHSSFAALGGFGFCLPARAIDGGRTPPPSSGEVLPACVGGRGDQFKRLRDQRSTGTNRELAATSIPRNIL